VAYTEYETSGEQAKKLRKDAGRYLKELRQKARLTQQQLAKRLGLDYYTFISQVENGFNRVPPEKLADWAAALNVPVEVFAKELLRYYDPFIYKAIFSGDVKGKSV
jgi:transcriptional regulator with XRE-family HTH domain